MAARKNQIRTVARPHKPIDAQSSSARAANISPRWLLTAVALTLAGAALCAWLTLCLLFWQGSWQLLYHPKTADARVPSNSGVAFEPVGFAATETGQLRIQGWWIPAATGPLSRFTILYLHGAKGNLGDCVEDLARLHEVGVNVLAFDYRGYGQSQFAHPNEARWLEDANWALGYLTQTRHISAHTIVVQGKELGANLALELAAVHPELAGVVLELPVNDPASVIFNDPRAHLIPAHLLVKDRYDADSAAATLRIPSLWILPPNDGGKTSEPAGFSRVTARVYMDRLSSDQEAGVQTSQILSRWFAGLK